MYRGSYIVFFFRITIIHSLFRILRILSICGIFFSVLRQDIFRAISCGVFFFTQDYDLFLTYLEFLGFVNTLELR